MLEGEEKAAIQRMQDAIRRKRLDLGLPTEGPVDTATLIEALRKNAPRSSLLDFVRKALASDRGGLRRG